VVLVLRTPSSGRVRKFYLPGNFLTSAVPSTHYRFRQEYRLEKKLLSELSLDPETCPVDEKDLSAMVATSPSSHAYRISRVVVLHNDKLETFVDQKKDAEVDGFFDNDSFWSGSITWY